MDVTPLTWFVALAGLLIMGILATAQFIAVLRPRSQWTIDNVYGGSPEATDPTAYFAFNQGYAWASICRIRSRVRSNFRLISSRV